jgi:hypothetical protein
VGRGPEQDVAVPSADKLECRVVQQEHEEVHHGNDGSASAHRLGGLVALTFAHHPRLPYFAIKKPRIFYDSSYVSDMYEISRAAHKAAKENLEEQRDRQEDYYNKKSKYRTFTPGTRSSFTTPTRRRASVRNFSFSGKHSQ